MIALSQVSDTASSTEIVSSADATTPPSAEPTESPSPTPTESATVVATAAAAPSAYTLPTCPPDVKNHGAYVSGVAHSAPKGKDGEHGSWVSQAAQSDCGKSSDASSQPEPPETESPETHAPKPAHTPASHSDVPKLPTSGKHNSGKGDH